MVPDSEDHEAIRRLLHDLNDAWVSGRLEALGQHLDDDMVMVPPGLRKRLVGREACVESYRDFVRRARVRGFIASEPLVEVWGDTAVARYGFQLDYEMYGEDHRDLGQDLFVFTRRDGRWRAVWRTLLPQAGCDLKPLAGS